MMKVVRFRRSIVTADVCRQQHLIRGQRRQILIGDKGHEEQY